MAVRPGMIEAGSGMEAPVIITVPDVLVKGTAEVSPPVLKLSTSKNVWLLLIEPLPLVGTRLIEYESPGLVLVALSVRAARSTGVLANDSETGLPE